MGIYLNPGNAGFVSARAGRYVDKSGLIAVVNNTIGKKEKLTCISRARRFGKSYAAKMLCAYYDRSCDSSSLFEDLEIAGHFSYREHLNRYHVIYLDITNIVGKAGLKNTVDYISEAVMNELMKEYPRWHISPTETIICSSKNCPEVMATLISYICRKNIRSIRH